MRFVEVSHPVEVGMHTYPGLPAPHVDILRTHDSGFYIASLHLCGNTGTYIDAPIHRFREGLDLAALPLERLAHLPIEVIDVRSKGRAITHQELRNHHLQGKAVLFHTGWSAHWRTGQYFQQHPFLTKDCCQALLDAGANFAGIDSLNIDDTNDDTRPAHTLLLQAGVPICEHMTNLASLSAGGYLHAVPIAWVGGASFPVRAYVME